jgi:hypothetical protein
MRVIQPALRRAATAVLITLLPFCGSGTAGATPLTGPIVNPANGHSYYLLANTSWGDSEREAIHLGGHLATINDAAEQNWVYQSFGGYAGGKHLLWIGLTDARVEGQYRWLSGQPLTYTNWASGEPNNSQGGEDYVAMYYPGHSSQSKWNDWTDRVTDPIGLPFNGVVEVQADTAPKELANTNDGTWLTFAPSGNQEGQSINSDGLAYEAANPKWKSDPAFDTSTWQTGTITGGSQFWGPDADTPVYMRKLFDAGNDPANASIILRDDDDALVYINGVLVIDDANGTSSAFGPMDVTSYLHAGENLIAVKAHDSGGGAQHIGLSVYADVPEPTVTVPLLGLAAFSALRRRRTRR